MIYDHAREASTDADRASDTNILDNFDCLDAIFSLKCLSILDLCSIGEAHSSFKEVVDEVFSARHKKYELCLRNKDGDAMRILKNFGALIQELSIANRCRGNTKCQCLDLMMEYCNDDMQSLDLSQLRINESQTIKLKPFFEKPEKISLCFCNVYSGKMLFSNCESLVELSLLDVQFDDSHSALENTFPKLNRFVYCYTRNTTVSFDDSTFNDFFPRHKNLKALILNPIKGTSEILPIVANNCKQLSELAVTIKEDKDLDEVQREEANLNILKFIQGLANVMSLEWIYLRRFSYHSEFFPAILKITKLKVLELYDFVGPVNLNLLAEFKGLTILKITSTENVDFDLVDMIDRLINLKTLCIYIGSFRMDALMYRQIIDVLRERPDRHEISCFREAYFVPDSKFDKILKIKGRVTQYTPGRVCEL